MSILDDVSLWASPSGERPPPQWNGSAWSFANLDIYASNELGPDTEPSIVYVGSAPLPGSLTFNFTFQTPRTNVILVLGWSIDGEFQGTVTISSPLGDVPSYEIDLPADATEFAWEVFAQYPESGPGVGDASGTTLAIGDGVELSEVSFNCECDEPSLERELADLRRSLLRRLGFSAQASNPPPGMAELLDDFLRDAQEQLYMRYACLRTERYFRWTLQPGVRYYGVQANADLCDKKLNPYRVTWAGVQDSDGTWYPLIYGIPALFYTSTNFQRMPSHYEVRDCIEVFPTPNAYYTLRVRGHFGLLPFTEDDHQCTIDSHAVFLLALANAKAHYRQPDAPNYFAQSNSYIGSLVAGSHGTRRYVPRMVERPPMTRPRMVRFDDE